MNQDKLWEALLRISEEAHTPASIEAYVATIHEILSGLIPARNFFVGLYEESLNKYFFPYFEDEYDRVETTFLEYYYDEALEVNMYDLSRTLSDHVRRTGNPIRFPNEELNKLTEKGEIKIFGTSPASLLGVPLKLAGKSIGVMVVQNYQQENAYSTKDEELMVFVSDHIARAIEGVRVEEQIRKQNKQLLRQTEAITDSIRYARRIQRAALPSPPYIDNILSEYFTFYRPRDIISGDFYWVREIEGYQVVIVSDCTGHGVPGALMSMLGVTLLNEQFRFFGIRSPGEILGHLRDKVKQILVQEGAGTGGRNSFGDQKDGMDMSIVIIDPLNGELRFAGANRPLYLVRKKGGKTDKALAPHLASEQEDHALFVLKGDRQPIGVHWEEKPFTSTRVNLQYGDTLYMFTDGYVDQYGGDRRKKFKNPKFQQLLLSVQGLSMEDQKRHLAETFDRWRGKHEQIDDVTVFSLRVTF